MSEKYQWVKLPRNALPTDKGIMGSWMKLTSRAAFRKGMALYCGYENAVEPGMWAGGVVGLKSMLGVRSRIFGLHQAVTYSLPDKTFVSFWEAVVGIMVEKSNGMCYTIRIEICRECFTWGCY